MTQHKYIFLIAVVCGFLATCSSRPAGEQSGTRAFNPEVTAIAMPKSLMANEQKTENTDDILEKIRQINEKLAKPQRQQLNYNKYQADANHDQLYILDEDTINKLQQLIDNEKRHDDVPSFEEPGNYNGINTKSDVDSLKYSRSLHSGALSPYVVAPTSLYSNQIPTGFASIMPYGLINYNSLPTLLLPTPSNNANLKNSADVFQYSRQTPSIPFQIPWPLAPIFPILIKDPLLTFLQGGGFNNLFEYGQSADVCRKSKSESSENIDSSLVPNSDIHEEKEQTVTNTSSRKSRAIKKRTISEYSQKQDIKYKNNKKSNRVLKNKIIKKKPPVQIDSEEESEENDDYKKLPHPADGDLRWPFAQFGLFGNKKPVVPSPGFFINRLKVRRGGVAIAGPGGVATAGRGGTAIVGPGGMAYTQPGGMAIAGPSAKVVAISGETDMSSLISRLQQAQATGDDGSRKLKPLPEGRVVANGPVVYYHKDDEDGTS